MDTQILEDLGLTTGEIKTYLTLIELGTSHAGEIVQKSSLHTSVVHRALNSLIEKGLINYIREGKRRIYQATDPRQFYTFMDEKRRKFDEILPQLQEKQAFSKRKENAGIYKGKKGITEVYTKLTNSLNQGEYVSFGGGKDCLHCMGETWWKNIHAKRIANNIASRQVFDETVKEIGTHVDELPHSDIRYLSSEFASFQETVIIGDLVAITIFTDNAYSVLIEDALVAEGYRKHFEVLWNNAFS